MTQQNKVEAKELRIGNVIQYATAKVVKKEFHNTPVVLEAKDIAFINDYPDSEIYKYLPLTEEWLIKFGFIREDVGEGINE